MKLLNIDEIYPAIDKLVSDLRLCGCSRLADILDHRMHTVPWNSRAELFEELQEVLTNFLKTSGNGNNVPDEKRIRVEQILESVTKYLSDMRT